jgi:hypothetical protein
VTMCYLSRLALLREGEKRGAWAGGWAPGHREPQAAEMERLIRGSIRGQTTKPPEWQAGSEAGAWLAMFVARARSRSRLGHFHRKLANGTAGPATPTSQQRRRRADERRLAVHGRRPYMQHWGRDKTDLGLNADDLVQGRCI